MAGPRLGVASAGTSLYQALCIAIAGGEAAMRWLSSRLAARGERYRRGVVRNRAVALCSGKHYISRAGLRGALEYIPGALRSRRELSLSLTLVLGIWRPPTYV